LGAETSGFRESDPDMPIQSQLSYGSSMFLRFPWPVCNLLYCQFDTTHPRTPRKMRNMLKIQGNEGKSLRSYDRMLRLPCCISPSIDNK
jgi:hypothetical protein